MSMARKLYEYKSLQLEVKDVDSSSGVVSGYFSAFNIEDSYKDVMMPGAFTKTIMEQGPYSKRPRIKHLMNHDVSMPIGKITELKEDSYGLYYESKPGTNNAGQDFMKMVESGLITEHSIGFITIQSSYNRETEIRQISEVKLFEGSSLTGWGVNQYTPLLGVKTTEEIDQRIKRLEKFCRNTDATDETIEMLLLEVRQLQQALQEAKQTTPAAVEAQVPEVMQTKLDAALITAYLSL